jgi:hypothetical protein
MTATASNRSAIPADPGVSELVGQLSEQLSRLVRAELELAKKELSAQAKVVAVGAGTFGAGAVLLLVAGACSVAAAILGLSNVMQPWLAALVVAAACVIAALVIVAPGWKGIRDRRPPVPHDTIANLRSDLAAVADGLHH